MSKLAKLLVTAAVLPGMIDIPTVIADTTDNQSTINEKSVVTHDGASNQESLTLEHPKATLRENESLDEWMPNKDLQDFVANYLQIDVSEITKEKLEDSGLAFSNFSDGFAFLTFDSYQGLEYFSSVVMNLSVHSQEDTNFFNANPINWEKLSHVNESTMITLDGYLQPMFPDGIDMANENIMFDPHNVYTPVNVKLNSSNYKSFFVSYKDLGFNNASGRVQWSNVNGLYTSDGTPIQYQTTQTADGVRFTFESDIDYSQLEGLTIHSESPEQGGPYNYPSGPYVQSVFTSDVDGNSMGQYINNPINISFSKVAGDVTVKHVEKATGVELPGSYTVQGNVGDAIKADPLDFDGYTFLETEWPTEATTEDGSPAFTENPQTVTHYYTRDVAVGADVTVQYVDKYGNKLADSETLQGNVGDAYTAKRKDIKGYVFSRTLDNNETGTFTDKAQTVTLVYELAPTTNNDDDQKDPAVVPPANNDEPKGSTTVPPVNNDGNQNTPTNIPPLNNNQNGATIVSGNSGASNDVTIGQNNTQSPIVTAVTNNKQAELPDTHAERKSALPLALLAAGLLVSAFAVVIPNKKH